MRRLATYQITEHEAVRRGQAKGSSVKSLPPDVFDALKAAVTAPAKGEEVKFISHSHRRGGEFISAKNWVGAITLPGVAHIEILPKIDGKVDADSREIFLKMLRSLRREPYKNFRQSHAGTSKMYLFEVFISDFINEVDRLIRLGLAKGYTSTEGNEKFLKGKIIFSEHIRRNAAHAERFYVRYDQFSEDRPENRLIKSALIKIKGISESWNNIRRAGRLLDDFEQVGESVDINADFERCVNDRSMREYDTALGWCGVFLRDMTFTPFGASNYAASLLFDMNKLFEHFVAREIKKYFAQRGFAVTSQSRGRYLFSEPRSFALNPDIVIWRRGTPALILDTKWKLLSSDAEAHLGISQADMYQMYAYHKRYGDMPTVLLYPHTSSSPDHGRIYKTEESRAVSVSFFDITDPHRSLDEISELLI